VSNELHSRHIISFRSHTSFIKGEDALLAVVSSIAGRSSATKREARDRELDKYIVVDERARARVVENYHTIHGQ
jgi:hypothetical protein